MTPSEIEKEAERIYFSLNHEPEMNYVNKIDFLMSRLSAVHDAAIEEAGTIADTWKWGGAMAKQIRALKIGEGK